MLAPDLKTVRVPLPAGAVDQPGTEAVRRIDWKTELVGVRLNFHATPLRAPVTQHDGFEFDRPRPSTPKA